MVFRLTIKICSQMDMKELLADNISLLQQQLKNQLETTHESITSSPSQPPEHAGSAVWGRSSGMRCLRVAKLVSLYMSTPFTSATQGALQGREEAAKQCVGDTYLQHSCLCPLHRPRTGFSGSRRSTRRPCMLRQWTKRHGRSLANSAALWPSNLQP